MKKFIPMIAVISAFCLIITGCSSTSNNDYVFGHNPEGYMSSNQPYEFDYCFNDLIGFKAEDGKSYAAFRDAGEIFKQYMSSTLDEDGNPIEYTEEDIDSELEVLYANAVNNYEESGCTIEDFTTDSGIVGKLIKVEGDLVPELATDFPVEGVEVENPVYYIFISENGLKTVYAYGTDKVAKDLVSTYSLEGTPNVELTQSEIEEKYSEIYQNYVSEYMNETEETDTNETDGTTSEETTGE